MASKRVAEAIERRCRTVELERLELGELGVSGGEGLVSVRLESKGRCRWRSVAAMRCISAMVMSLTSWRRRRRRRRWRGAGVSYRRPGLRRRRRRGASEPKAFLLLRQAGEGVAVARPRSGVRHVGAERWERAEDLEDGGVVPGRRRVCGAWLNQQRVP